MLMESTRGKIEYISNQHPFSGAEYVVIFNGSNQSHDLAGWKLVYEDISTGATLHTHHFNKLDGSFDPGERICVISGLGTDRFQYEDAETGFPASHWDIFTDRPMDIM